MNRKILLLSLISVCSLSLVSCEKEQQPSNPITNAPKTYEHYLIENGTSNYQFIYPDGASLEQGGASILASYLFQSTGVNIPVVKESKRDLTKNFISFGETKEYLSANLNMDKNLMNYDGYGIRSIDSNIYVIGGSGNSSYNYSATYLLNDFINFNGYTDTEIDFEYRNKVGFDSYELYDAPAFKNRDMFNGDLRIADDFGTYSLLLRNNPEVYSKYGNAHTCFRVVDPNTKPSVDKARVKNVLKGDTIVFEYNKNTINGKISKIEEADANNMNVTINSVVYKLEKEQYVKRTSESSYYTVHPDWFTGTGNHAQWCWSQEDLFETVAMLVEEYMETLMTSSINYIFISQNDFTDWCNCPACADSRTKYGTDAAVCVKFINKLADRVKAKQIELGIEDQFLKVGTFAYEVTTMVPPVKMENGEYVPIDDEVILRDNAFIRLAPITTDYSKSITHSVNAAILEAFEGWSVLTNNILLWSYNTNFNNFFYPFTGYEHLQEYYRFYKACNVTAVMEEGAPSQKQPGFIELRNYVSSKLLWNVDENIDILIQDFMKNYYKDASVYMKQFFDELRFQNEYIDANHLMAPSTGRIFGKYTPEDAYSFRQLKSWMNLIEKAKSSIEKYKNFNNELYDKLLFRIEKESLIIYYALIFGYLAEFPDSDALNLKKEFKRICEKTNCLYTSEGKTLVSTFTEWGL